MGYDGMWDPNPMGYYGMWDPQSYGLLWDVGTQCDLCTMMGCGTPILWAMMGCWGPHMTSGLLWDVPRCGSALTGSAAPQPYGL